MEDVFTDNILFTNQPTPEPIAMDDQTDDETIILDSPSRSASRASTLDLQLLSDDTLDELFVNTDSHPELTQDNYNNTNWKNVISISNYIRDLQLPGGVDGRTYTPQLPANPPYSRHQWNNTPATEAKSTPVQSRETHETRENCIMFAVLLALCFLAYLCIKCLNTMENWVAHNR